jgi:hypothetical protein
MRAPRNPAMLPNTPRYVTPKERAESRARFIRFSVAVSVVIPVAVALMMFGYSDHAPAWLRDAVASADSAFGYPVLWLMKMFMAR